MPASLREEIEKRAAAIETQEEVKSEETQTTQPPEKTPLKGISDKETNLRALAEAKAESDRKLAEAEAKAKDLESKASLLTDERYKKLFGVLESDYEADPEKLLTEFESYKSERTSFAEKLTEKEKLIEKIKFEESDSYKKNVAQPILSGEERLKGVLRKDDALYKKIKKEFLYDKEGKVLQGDLNADEIIALDELLEEHGGSIKSDRVEVAIVALREGFHQANEYYQNFQQNVANEKAEAEKATAAKNIEEARLAKLVRASAVKKSVGEFAANEHLKVIFGEEYIDSVGKTVLSEIEGAIETRQVPTVESMASRQMKARLWDKFVEDGGLDILKEAIETQSEHSQRAAGTKGSDRGALTKPSGSLRDEIAKRAGVTNRF